jgi:SAM-dependent methyltransferase
MAQSLEIYNQMDWWNPRHSLLQMAVVKFAYFREKIGALEGSRILDVGCGGGILAEKFAKLGANVSGIDLSETYAVHDWNKFIKPEELTTLAARHGLVNGEVKGIRPGKGDLKIGGKPWAMYVGYATKQPKSVQSKRHQEQREVDT